MNEDSPILLAEDDEVDAMCVKRAMKSLNVKNPLVHVYNGEEALAYLNGPGNPLPGIVLLDINMPRMNGLEFLQEIKTDERFKRIPIIVLTTSKDDKDRYDSFELGVAGYMVKPVEYSNFLETIRTVKQYWSLSELPAD